MPSRLDHSSFPAPSSDNSLFTSLADSVAFFSHCAAETFKSLSSLSASANFDDNASRNVVVVVFSRSSSSIRARARISSLSTSSTRARSLSRALAVVSVILARSYILRSAPKLLSPSLAKSFSINFAAVDDSSRIESAVALYPRRDRYSYVAASNFASKPTSSALVRAESPLVGANASSASKHRRTLAPLSSSPPASPPPAPRREFCKSSRAHLNSYSATAARDSASTTRAADTPLSNASLTARNTPSGNRFESLKNDFKVFSEGKSESNTFSLRAST